MRNKGLKGKNKLADRWEQEVHIVVKVNEGLPVYTIKKENGQGRERVLHRNMLLPCDCLPLKDVKTVTIPKVRHTPQVNPASQNESESEDGAVENPDPEKSEPESEVEVDEPVSSSNAEEDISIGDESSSICESDVSDEGTD